MKEKLKLSLKQLFKISTVFTLMVSCSTMKSELNNEKYYYKFVETYINFRNRNNEVNPEKNIIILSNILNDTKQTTSVYFVNPELLIDTEYKNVYGIGKYKLITTNDNLDVNFPKAKFFKNLEYENFNKAKFPYTYNLTPWTIIIEKNKIMEIFPQKDSILIRNLLEQQKFKFITN
ncbi:hypothetical protein [Soonwooa purpurea]